MTASRAGAGAKGGPPFALVNARLLDPATDLDAPGGVVIADGIVADIGPHLAAMSDARKGLGQLGERLAAEVLTQAGLAMTHLAC